MLVFVVCVVAIGGGDGGCAGIADLLLLSPLLLSLVMLLPLVACVHLSNIR